jgi:hypothetical protein
MTPPARRSTHTLIQGAHARLVLNLSDESRHRQRNR